MWARPLAAAILAGCCLCAAAQAAQYTTAPAVAQTYDLLYVDLSQDNIHACKLIGGGHEFVLFADLNSLLVDGANTALAHPVKWKDAGIQIPADGVALIAGTLGHSVEAPCAVATAQPPKPKRTEPFKVVIDAGHGGKDPGAVYAELQEKVVVLDIARRLERLLKAKGVTVVLTRRNDRYIALDDRVAIANREAPDLFLSVHANAERSQRSQGAMTLYPRKGPKDNKPEIYARARDEVKRRRIDRRHFGAEGTVNQAAMMAVAQIAFESYRWMSIDASEFMQRRLAPVTGTVSLNRGVIEDWRGLRVLARTYAPAILVEVDFLSNASRRRKLATAAYREEIAQAVSRAVMDFLQTTQSE